MHNAAFKHFGISAEYRIFDVEPDKLESFFKEFILGGKLAGLNVTVPYKVSVKEIVEKCEGRSVSIAPFPKIAGAINTLKVEASSISAYNTDGEGFYASLAEDASFDPKGKEVFVIGSGGAGRVISLYLASLGDDAPKRISVYDVDARQLASLRDTVGRYRGSGVLGAPIEIEKDLGGLAKCDLVVNATPLGTKEGDKLPIPPDRLEILKKKTVIYDLVYARETELVKLAKEKGIRAFTGEGMLAGQGALSFEKWTGKPLGEIKTVMRKVLAEALKRG
jgi:shikimate dehydrogenase